MTFLAWTMLGGLATVAIPVLLHVLHQRRARTVMWGAMHFLLGSVQRRRRRILLEEWLVLALRCLTLALVTLAMARPVAPPGGFTAWALAVVGVLAGTLCGAAAVLPNLAARWRAGLAALAVALVGSGLATPLLAGRLGLGGTAGGGRDVAVVLDASGSMQLRSEGRTGFDRALDEARAALATLGRSDSVSVVLAGGTARSIGPVAGDDRAGLAGLLDELTPAAGPADMPAALAAAADVLEAGTHQTKQVLVFTDGQAAAWDPENTPRWRDLAARLAKLRPGGGSDPARARQRVITVVVPPDADEVRNLTLIDVGAARTLVGNDRPVEIRATVKNTGTQRSEPTRVTLQIDGTETLEAELGSVAPGETVVVPFQYRFSTGGSKTLVARLAAGDDLPADDMAARVVDLAAALPVLVIEGSLSARPLDRSAAFVTAAISAPPPAAVPAPPAPGKPAPPPPPRGTGLCMPTVVSVAELVRVTDLAPYRLVIIADAAQLPPDFATRLAAYVTGGGSLLVVAGERALPSFFDEWRTEAGQPLTGVRLAERRFAATVGKVAHPNLESFSHPALVPLANPRQSDLNLAVFESWWQLVPHPDAPARIVAMLDTGDPLLTEARVGRGRVVTFAAALDRSGGSLPLRSSFVPLVLGLVADLATTDDQGLVNVVSDVSLRLRLPITDVASAAGLMAEYFKDAEFNNSAGMRPEPALGSNWRPGLPFPGMQPQAFSVTWSGRLVPLVTGPHTFYLSAGGKVGLRLDGKAVVPLRQSGGLVTLDLVAEMPVDFRVDLVPVSQGDGVRLEWEAPGLQRQVVPNDRYQSAGSLVASVEAREGRAETVDGRILPVKLVAGDDGLDVLGEFPAEPGLLRVTLPPGAARWTGDRWRVGIGVGVRPFAGETPFTPLTAADEQLLARAVDLVLPRSRTEVAAAMAGEAVGREFGTHLLLAALLVAIAEVAVTRWIAVTRGTASARVPEFSESATLSPRPKARSARSVA